MHYITLYVIKEASLMSRYLFFLTLTHEPSIPTPGPPPSIPSGLLSPASLLHSSPAAQVSGDMRQLIRSRWLEHLWVRDIISNIS